jgi:hypothetical protein
MIDTDAIDYCFINRVTTQKIYEIIEISSIQLNKSKKIERLMIARVFSLHTSFIRL